MEWIKLDVHITQDLRLRGFDAEEIAAWLSMMCIAGRENGNKRGRLRIKKRNARIDEIAMETGVSVEVVTSTLAKAIACALLVEVPDEDTGEVTHQIADWHLTQIDLTAVDRQRDSRARRREEQIPSVTRDSASHDIEERRREEKIGDESRHYETKPTYLSCESLAFEANCGPLEYSLVADSYGDPSETASSPYSDEERQALDHDRGHQMLCEAMLTPVK